MATLTSRKNRILQLIVDDYVSTAVPVASTAVAQSGDLDVSPATVRNEMVALEESGFILRPHVSAGSIPSDKGYRHFLETLDLRVSPTPADVEAVEGRLGEAAQDVDTWAESAATALSTLLSTLAFATEPRSVVATIKSIELLLLREAMIMLVVIMQEASVYKQVLTLERTVTPIWLEATRNKVSQALVGRTAASIDERDERLSGDLERKVTMSTLDLLRKHEADSVGDRRIHGIASLLAQPELEVKPTQASGALSAVENGDVLSVLTDEAPDNEPVVVIGTENPHEPLQGFSVVICRYGRSGEAQGVVGLVAPTRLQYRRAIPVVRHTADAMTRLVGLVYGGA